MTKNGIDPYTEIHEFVSGVLNPVPGDLTAFSPNKSHLNLIIKDLD